MLCVSLSSLGAHEEYSGAHKQTLDEREKSIYNVHTVHCRYTNAPTLHYITRTFVHVHNIPSHKEILERILQCRLIHSVA